MPVAVKLTMGADVLDLRSGSYHYEITAHFAAPDPQGRGARRAMEDDLRNAAAAPADVDYINLHATSTPAGDAVEANAIRDVFGPCATRLHVSATKSMTGHLLGGAGAVEAIACVLTLQHGKIPPTINTANVEESSAGFNLTLRQPQDRDERVVLSNAFGFGGHNTTLVLGRYDPQQRCVATLIVRPFELQVLSRE
jgi:3-oxoacyl-[acyl-carrier-protein] synthase II